VSSVRSGSDSWFSHFEPGMSDQVRLLCRHHGMG
jgi:hypothetical protein